MLWEETIPRTFVVRGFVHFWIAYLWGRVDQGVPYDGPENPEYQKRIPPQLASVKDNYAQVIADLTKAAELLPLFLKVVFMYIGL